MPRLPFVLLASFTLAAAHAQNLPSLPPGPISGRVLNAATGDPIPGAIVHYMGIGNVTDQQKRVLNPNTLRGEVTSGPDGSYTTPPLPALGEFHVRASAPGFFANMQSVEAIPAALRRPPPRLPPLPPGYHGPPPARHDGILRLQPDPLNLHPMSDAALASFAIPLHVFANREFISAVLSPDANTLTFRTLDTAGDDEKSITQRCRAWTYDLVGGTLAGRDMPGSPVTGVRLPDLPPDFCPGSNPADTQTTADGQFTVAWGPEEGWCGPLVVTSTRSPRPQTIATGCTDLSFILDRAGDRVIYTNPLDRDTTPGITEYTFKTGATRAFALPSRTKQPVFLATQSLSNGGLRMAYSVKGGLRPHIHRLQRHESRIRSWTLP